MKTISTFDAKNKLSEVIASAERGEPQIITRNGRQAAVIISYSDFQKLTARRETLSEFLLKNPVRDSRIDLTRSKEPPSRPVPDFNDEEFV